MCHEEKQVSGVGFQVSGFRFQVSGFRFQVSGFGFRVSGFRFQVSGVGFQVSGPPRRAGSTALEIGSENPRAKARATLANFFPGLKARASTLNPFCNSRG
jgi:hypothetical protein